MQSPHCRARCHDHQNLSALNPQPLPPGPPESISHVLQTLQGALHDHQNLSALNPQPLPPGPP